MSKDTRLRGKAYFRMALHPVTHLSHTRVVGYHVPPEGPEVHPSADKLFEKAMREGVITQWDDGRGHPWWNGPPGKAMRAFNKTIRALIGR